MNLMHDPKLNALAECYYNYSKLNLILTLVILAHFVLSRVYWLLYPIMYNTLFDCSHMPKVYTRFYPHLLNYYDYLDNSTFIAKGKSSTAN